MTTPTWQAGRLYPPGSLVRPTAAPAPTFNEVPNGDFEAGNTGWVYDGAFVITNSGDAFTGSWSLEFLGSAFGFHSCEMATDQAVLPGDSITARCQVQQGASNKGLVGGNITIIWLDAAHAFIRGDAGNVVNDGSGGAWHASTVTAVAPANARFAKLALHVNRVGDNDPLWIDNVEWDYISRAVPEGLVFKAVQPKSGYSAATEPSWPNTTGVQVIDNEVIWEGVLTSRVIWEAQPILLSGAVEPNWPAQAGANVADNTIIWQAVTLRVEDPKCPNSKVVAKAGAKIYAADDDIVPYCATGNPLDWSSPNDAGFLPVGMNQAQGSNPVTLLNQYRKNLAVMSASGFQNWQVDPDPAQIELLDTMEGIGSVYHLAAQPVSNDLFYLSNQGVRTIGLSASANNLNAGDVGMPIDPLVKIAMQQVAKSGVSPLGTYLPSMGQYWLTFSNFPPSVLSLAGNLANLDVDVPITPYAYQASGGVPPYSFTIASGALPDGLSMDEAGVVTGTPATYGTFNWTVRVTDAFGETADVADTAGVTETVWWATGINATSGVYVSGDPTNFNVPVTTRAPNMGSAPIRIVQSDTTGTVLLVGATQLERIVDLDTAGGITVERVVAHGLGLPVQPVMARCIDGIFFIFNDTATFAYSTDDGRTWQQYVQPNGRQFRDICRLNSGRWVSAWNQSSTQQFIYSDEPGVPTTWQVAANLALSSFNGKTFACDGARAVLLSGSGRCNYTDDGATWVQFNAPNSEPGTRLDATFVGDTVIFVGQSATGAPRQFTRSRDRGLTWELVPQPTNEITSIQMIHHEPVSGATVFSGQNTAPIAKPIVYSYDLTETMDGAAMPSLVNATWVTAPVRRVPPA